MAFMTGNHYINQDVQKAFLDGVPGCVKHQFKLWSALADAQRNQRNIHVCWLDIANAYGSVRHNLIVQALHHYHLPAHSIRTVSSLYSNLVRWYPHTNGYRTHFTFRLEFTKAIPYLLPFSML